MNKRHQTTSGASLTKGQNDPALESWPACALVVDDDPEIAFIAEEALSRIGYKVETVNSALTALEKFDSFKPDILITDWKMPDMNGIELITALREKDPHIATVLMTGFGTKEVVVDAFTRGKIDYYISKPFRLNELIEIVGAAVKNRRLKLNERDFRNRLVNEIQQATLELEAKNRLLEEKHSESQELYKELRSRNKEIESTKDYLEGLLESSPDAIISTDVDQNISYFSRGAEEMFHYVSEDIMGRPLAQLFSPEHESLTQLYSQLKRKKRLKHFEARMIDQNGGILITDISASLLGEKNGLEKGGIILIIKDIADRKRLEEELKTKNSILEKMSITDGLTGLYNHRRFQTCLQDEFQRARRFNGNLALIMLDLDDFKKVNDSYGHQVGDQVLILLSSLIRECVREVDTPARYGGEEFAIILPQTDVHNALVVAGRIKDAVENSPAFQDIQSGLKVTASLGLAAFPDDEIDSPKDLIRFADRALYRAKGAGKNRVIVGSSKKLGPAGGDEQLSTAERRSIIHRTVENLRGALDLNEALKYLVTELADLLRDSAHKPACSIMLMDDDIGLKTSLVEGVDEEIANRFELSAGLALEKRDINIFPHNDPNGPTTSIPLIIDWPATGEEVLGVINLGVIPSDLEFFRELCSHTAICLLNAKLLNEFEQTRNALNIKINELTTLSFMGMALHRNALLYDDYKNENNRLLARCLAWTGFKKVLVYEYDSADERLYNGSDNSLRGSLKKNTVSLNDLDSASPLIRRLATAEREDSPIMIIDSKTEEENPVRELFQLTDSLPTEAAIGALCSKKGAFGLVIAYKDNVLPEDADMLSRFLLHASLIMEYLEIAGEHQETSKRLKMIYEIGGRLSPSLNHEENAIATQETLENLAGVLRIKEISLYLYEESSSLFKLAAYASKTAQPGQEPVKMISLDGAELMGGVVRESIARKSPEYKVINNLESNTGLVLKDRFNSNSYLGVPLHIRGRIIGVLNLTDKYDNSEFSPEDVELARITGGILAMGLRID